MRNRVVLVQCTNDKRDGEHRARDLYDTSAYFRKQRRYAEAVADTWFIQSAEYGLLEPTAVIESYDTHAGDIDNPTEWAREIAADLSGRVGRGTVELLGGRHYADPLRPELERRGFSVREPLEGKAIGERMAWLDGRVEEAVNGCLIAGDGGKR